MIKSLHIAEILAIAFEITQKNHLDMHRTAQIHTWRQANMPAGTFGPAYRYDMLTFRHELVLTRVMFHKHIRPL